MRDQDGRSKGGKKNEETEKKNQRRITKSRHDGLLKPLTLVNTPLPTKTHSVLVKLLLLSLLLLLLLLLLLMLLLLMLLLLLLMLLLVVVLLLLLLLLVVVRENNLLS